MPRKHQLRCLIWLAILMLCYVVRTRAALTLYIQRKFAVDHMRLDVNNDIFLIKNGIKHDVFKNPDLFRETTRPLASSLERVELTWFSVRHEERYSIRVSSKYRKILPVIKLPSRQGTVGKISRTFVVELKCTGLEKDDILFSLNYTNFKKSGSVERTLQFTVTKLCGSANEGSGDSSNKTTVGRTVVVTVSASLTLFVCVLVGGVFFWRYVKRIRRKFGFDETREQLSPRRQSFTSSNISIPAPSQLPTVVYSPKGKPSNSCFTKIAKHEPTTSHSCDSPDIKRASPISFDGNFNRESLIFSQISISDEDVFTSEQSSESLIQREDSTLSLVEDLISDKERAFATLNEYWSEKLGDSIKTSEDVEIRSEVLGEGTFGRVFRGKLKIAHSQEVPVDLAVKTCQENIEFDHMVSFVNEAILMKGLSQKNVLELLGVVLQPCSAPIILTPYMHHGDLHKFLRHSRGVGIRRQLIGSRQLVNFASQIAAGMEYLAAQKIVHRDLAARNCFVDEKLNVKIGDFGLAREVKQFNLYKMEHPTQLAVKWLALESLLYYIFTEKTDVWSFGIVLWELVTLGSQPYAGLDNYEVMPYLETGKRLPRPLRCPDDLYTIMQSCWLFDPEDRPSFSILVHKLEDYELRLRPSCITFEFDEDTVEMSDGLF